MKKIIKFFVDAIIIRFINYCIDRMHPIQIITKDVFNVNLQNPAEIYTRNPIEISSRNPIEISSHIPIPICSHNPIQVINNNNCISLAYEEARRESVDIIMKHIDSCMLFASRELLWEYCLNRMSSGLIIEFGVFEGYSINYFSRILSNKNDSRIIHGFDSFDGLPDDWRGTSFEKGVFSLNSKLPEVYPNVMLHKGIIQDTLMPFLDKYTEDIALIHVDTDIYSSAFYILSTLKNRCRPGTIIIFDELLSYPGYKFGEYKALLEVFDDNQFRYIGFSSHEQVAIQII